MSCLARRQGRHTHDRTGRDRQYSASTMAVERPVLSQYKVSRENNTAAGLALSAAPNAASARCQSASPAQRPLEKHHCRGTYTSQQPQCSSGQLALPSRDLPTQDTETAAPPECIARTEPVEKHECRWTYTGSSSKRSSGNMPERLASTTPSR